MKGFAHFFTKTVIGAVVAAIGYVSSPEILAILPKKGAAVVTCLGAVVSVLGLRNAVAKNGAGK